MNVLLVSPYYAPASVYGGPTQSLPLLCRGLADAGARVTVFATNANGHVALDVPLDVPIRRDGAEVHYFPRTGRAFRSTVLARACFTRAHTFDIVQISGIWSHPVHTAIDAARSAGVPYIVSPRGMLMPWEMNHKAWKKRPYYVLRERARLRNAAAIHCTSGPELSALRALGLGHLGLVIANPVDLPALEPKCSGGLLARLGIKPRERAVAYIGRLHPKKGIELTLEAYARAAAVHHDLHLLIAGPDDGYAGPVRDAVLRIGRSGRIHLLGQLDRAGLSELYASTDAVLLLSESENFGMAAAEAMAAGTAVIVTRTVGIAPMVEQWRAGLVVERDPVAASDAIVTILIEDTAHRMGANGRRAVTAELSPFSVGRTMLELYARIVQRSAAA